MYKHNAIYLGVQKVIRFYQRGYKNKCKLNLFKCNCLHFQQLQPCKSKKICEVHPHPPYSPNLA